MKKSEYIRHRRLKQLGRFASLNQIMYIVTDPVHADHVALAGGPTANHDEPPT